MKKIYFILFLLLLILIQTATVFAEDITYIDKKYGFSITYPSEFRFSKDASKGYIVLAFPKKDFSLYADNITVIASHTTPSCHSAEEIIDIYFKYSKSVIKREKILINGINFLSVIQTQKMFFLNLKQYHLITTKGTKIYTITYAATIENYDKFLDKAKQIMHTFKFID